MMSHNPVPPIFRSLHEPFHCKTKKNSCFKFKVEYLGGFLTKSDKTLDYDYLDRYLLI